MTGDTMWMARGDGGRRYDAFQDRGIIAIGGSEPIEAKAGMSGKELAGIYARAGRDLKQGTIISGGSQVWRFINEVALEDFCITYDRQPADMSSAKSLATLLLSWIRRIVALHCSARLSGW